MSPDLEQHLLGIIGTAFAAAFFPTLAVITDPETSLLRYFRGDDAYPTTLSSEIEKLYEETIKKSDEPQTR
jgi:hypothetical protein